MAISTTSRYRGSALIVDEGNLRLNRNTTYLGDYAPFRYVEREDNRRHLVRAGETLDHLATAFLFDPELFWVIADFQPTPIINPFEPLEPGRTLVIPSVDFVRTVILRA